MDFQLTEQQRRMVAAVRELAQGEFKAKRAKVHGRHVSLGKHEEARRDRRARHVGAGRIWRPRPAGVRYRAAARGDRQDLLRDRDGDARRGRRADPRDRDLRAREHSRADPSQGRLRRLHVGGLHDRAACRHRCRELPDQRRHQGRPRHPQRHQDADQPGQGGRHVRHLHADRRQARPRRHRLRSCWSPTRRVSR